MRTRSDLNNDEILSLSPEPPPTNPDCEKHEFNPSDMTTIQPSKHLDAIRTFVQTALLSSSTAPLAFLPIIRLEFLDTPNIELFGSLSQVATDAETSTIRTFIADAFPALQITEPRDIGRTSEDNKCNSDCTVIPISTRIDNALMQAYHDELAGSSDGHSIAGSAARFLASVNIVHELAHAVRMRFDRCTIPVLSKITLPPYYYEFRDCEAVAEAGFMVEEIIFGGVVHVVLKGAIDAQPPPSELDLTKIDYFFLMCRNGTAYRIGVFRPHVASLDCTELYDRFAGDFSLA